MWTRRDGGSDFILDLSGDNGNDVISFLPRCM